MSDAATGIVPDPFAPQTHVAHSALSRNTIHGSEYDPTLFDKFFASPAFRAWSSGNRSWQLHCYGEPGCGKTTVAAFAADHLPPIINGTRTAVASICITEHVWSTSLDFVEDLFQLIYSEFGVGPNADHEAYQLACYSGKSSAERIQKLLGALSGVASGACKFLILDGYDRINEALQSAVDVHFAALKPSGFRVMTTRRVPIFSVALDRQCDGCGQKLMKLWWTCSCCNMFDLCYDCEKQGVLDESHLCSGNGFVEIYQHVSIKLGDFDIERLLAKRLSTDYPDVQLEMSNRIVAYIGSNAGGNLTLALLYLEDTFTRNDISTFSVDRVEDRLPRDVVAYFDNEMSFIERKPEPQRLPPILAIAAAADHQQGIPLETLERCIRLAQSTCANLDYPRSVEDVLIAANGWLTNLHTMDRRVEICCRPAFSLYVQEQYNNSLAWARRQVRFHEISSPSETPDLIGNKSDTSASQNTSPIPFESLEHTPGPCELQERSDRALFHSKDEELHHSPPRPSSIESVPKMPYAHLTDDEPEGNVTQRIAESTRPPMPLCDFCVRNVFECAASSGQHRVSIDRANAALNQCAFCSTLYADVDDSISNTEIWPLYTWTLRALPSGRELRGSMMLRFWSSHLAVTTKSFRFLPGNDLQVPKSGDLHGSTDPEESGGTQINRWMETCMRDHQGCSKTWHVQRHNLFFLPTRLLDVDTGDESTVRLVDTKLSKAKGPYCTLSHAWGQGTSILTTTVWNMAKHLITGITLDELPLNFQQAIQVTRFLKVRYLWIDSLAIVQEPFGDFAREADLMHKVYRYSHCNIVAADSKSADGGLFRKRIPHDILPAEYQGTLATHRLGEKNWTVVPSDLWERELLSSVIYSRGWVFQERILSPRLLHFTKHQIFWDCGTLSACEVFPSGLPFPLDNKASTDRHWRGRLVKSTVPSNALTGVNDNESSYTFWMSAVKNYTECDLTNHGDKTIAIWSIAKLLRDFTDEQYAVGMWSQALEEQLAWRLREPKTCERIPELDVNIPSWSWASVKGSVMPQHRLAIRSYKVIDHAGAIVQFAIKDKTRQGDKEPLLQKRALELKTPINVGRLIKVQENKYLLRVSNETSSDAIEMNAFPDTPIMTMGIDLEQCAFTILAASATSHSVLDSSPEIVQTYSGIGLLLVTHSAWFASQEQLYHEYKSELAGAQPSRQQEWRLNAFGGLMLQQSERLVKTRGQIASIYRRIGALQFHDLDEQGFDLLTNDQRQKNIWLE